MNRGRRRRSIGGRRALAAWLALCAGLVGFGARGASAGEDPPDRVPVRRTLVISLPHLTWESLETAPTPNLDALLAESSIADLAVRVVRRKTSPETGYTTIGAGTRALAGGQAGLAMAPDEEFSAGRAGDAYARRMGQEPSSAILMLTVPQYFERNEQQLFGGEAGALGSGLAEAGIHRAVIANADRTLTDLDSSEFHREAVAMLMDREGRVPGGRVDRGLLIQDRDAPFGLRLDQEAVLEAFDAEWRDRAVVAVEASDLVRAESYRSFVRSSLRDGLSAQALVDADRLVGRLLERVDPRRDAVVVVGPASPRGKPQLTIAAVRAPEFAPSLLVTSTTRRDGFITIYDVGAGIADLMGVERPSSMEGRPFEVGDASGTASSRRAFLVDENAEAQFRDDTVGWFTALFVALQLLLALAAVLVYRYGKAGPPVAFAALVILAMLPMQYLAGLVQFSDVGIAAYVAFIFGGAGLLAAGAWLAGRGDALASAAWLLVVVVGVIVVNVTATNSVLQFNTVFGDSPIIAGRFTGVNNLTFSQLAVGGILLGVLIAHRFPGKVGVLAAIGLLAFLLVVDGAPVWGADVGGVLTAVPAFAYVGYRLLGSKISLRTVVFFGVATLVVIGAFAAIDLAQPSEDRTHLGRLLEQVDAQGSDAFVTVILRKLAANFRVITSSVWLFMVPGALAFAAFVMWRRPEQVKVIEHRIPSFGIALAGTLVAGVLGFALNDSGVAVPGMMLGVLNPVMVHLGTRLHNSAPPPAVDEPTAAEVPTPAPIGR